MKLTTMTQVTIDGVMQGNGVASDDRRNGFERGGWARGKGDDETRTFITQTYQRAEAFLFGRRTYELFAGSWGSIDQMRAHPIGVASHTWADTSVQGPAPSIGPVQWDVLHTGGPVMSDKKESARSTSAKASNLLSDEERAAMKETLKERRRALSGAADGESDVLAKIAEMPEPDRGIATRLHAIIKASAPTLSPKTWYGMPAYAKEGKVVCFFQSGQKFKSRYATLGFQDAANLDDGDLWPTSFAVKSLTAAVVEKIAKLVEKAAS
jgi:uncharacterized protein YdhG (YjbR/CyaY superfamily)